MKINARATESRPDVLRHQGRVRDEMLEVYPLDSLTFCSDSIIWSVSKTISVIPTCSS